ncbi:MAG: DUF4372 domain-containing protein [Bacteroidales bacterium]|nr:DUF4372 domain-containing protein [Bacteroidales bacterium]
MGRNSFKELINFLNKELFMACVDKYQTDKYHKYHDSWSHLILLLYCHFNNIFSLRQLEKTKDYPVECKLLSKSHFSYQNNHRNFRAHQ